MQDQLELKNDKKLPTMSIMSKKRYHEIVETLSQVIPDPVQHALTMNKICSIMKFDPSISRYTKELGQKTKAYRHKLRDEKGISTYVTSGAKKYYESLKQKNTDIAAC